MALMVSSRARTLSVLHRKSWRTLLCRVYRHCKHHGWWPSASDLHHPGRSLRTPWTLRRRLRKLAELGYVQKASVRQWCLTPAGFVILGADPIVATRRWRKKKASVRVLASEVLDVCE